MTQGPPLLRGLCAVVTLWAACTAEARAAEDFAWAQQLYRAGRYREAAAALETLARVRPADGSVQLWYGASLLGAGRLHEAVGVLQRATLGPLSAHAWLWTGAAYEQLGQLERARASYEEALRRAGTGEVAYLALRRLRALRAPPSSPAALSAAVDPAAYARLATLHNPRLSALEARRIGQALVAYGRRFDVDPRFVSALVLVESGFNPRAVSPAGALGLGQLMPETARAVGVRDPFSIEENLYGTVRVLRGHLDRFGYHRADLALAAYNAGAGAVHRHGGVPPFPETQWYVFHVTRLYLRYLGR